VRSEVEMGDLVGYNRLRKSVERMLSEGLVRAEQAVFNERLRTYFTWSNRKGKLTPFLPSLGVEVWRAYGRGISERFGGHGTSDERGLNASGQFAKGNQ